VEVPHNVVEGPTAQFELPVDRDEQPTSEDPAEVARIDIGDCSQHRFGHSRATQSWE